MGAPPPHVLGHPATIPRLEGKRTMQSTMPKVDLCLKLCSYAPRERFRRPILGEHWATRSRTLVGAGGEEDVALGAARLGLGTLRWAAV
jgi:hypothetical protein